MNRTLVASVLLLSACAADADGQLFADSKCRGYEFYFLNRAAANQDTYAATLLLKGARRNIALKSYMTILHCLANEIYLELLG